MHERKIFLSHTSSFFSVTNIDVGKEFQELFSHVKQIKVNCLNGTDSTILELLNSEPPTGKSIFIPTRLLNDGLIPNLYKKMKVGGLILTIISDSKVAIQLHLLPSLIPPRGRTRGPNKKTWKLSTSESRDSLFFIHIKTPGDIDKIKQERVDFTLQPYLILVGPSLNNITSALVVVNGTEYKCQSVTEAVNFCFKLYQILDANYPQESRHLWYLIQWLVFKYFNKADPQIPLIASEFV